MSKEQEQFEDIEIYPAEASEQGINAYYLPGCDVVGHRPAYVACLKKIADRKDGRLTTSLSECSAAIGKKECPAQKMRKEELVEGRAIYFINRKKFQSFQQYQTEMEQQRFAAMPQKVGKSPKHRPTVPHAAPAHFLDVTTGSYADAINAAAKEPAPPAIVPAEQSKLATAAPIQAGISLFEMARLHLAAQVA